MNTQWIKIILSGDELKEFISLKNTHLEILQLRLEITALSFVEQSQTKAAIINLKSRIKELRSML